MGLYLRPTELDEAVAALAANELTVLAGGTDFYPARVGRALDDDVLDISAIPELRGIVRAGEEIRIGAATTWSDIAAASLPPSFDALKAAAREIGGLQIQNAGTLGGNLCNASPAADGIPCLLALDAVVDLASADGIRSLPLGDFVLGNRRTARRPVEMMTAIRVRLPRGETASRFLKLGARRYLVISIVMTAVVLERTPAGEVAAARIAVGACSAAAQRLPELERALVGKSLEPGLGGLVEARHLAPLAPIDDVRGTAAYRRDAALSLVARALEELAA
jgi:CO/xanthine dehydrogenase FAD-binding subunit